MKNKTKELTPKYKNILIGIFLVISFALFYIWDQNGNKKIIQEIKKNLAYGTAKVIDVNTDGISFKNGSSLELDIYINGIETGSKFYYVFPGQIYCKNKLIGKLFPLVYSTKHSEDGSKYSRVLILKKDFSELGLNGQPDSLSWVNECFEGQCYDCDN